MPEFQYIAKELSGREVTGTLSAQSEQDVVRSLAGQMLFPVRIHTATAAGPQRVRGKRIKTRQLVTLYGQMADLLRSGVPLLRSLEILVQQDTKSALSAILQDVKEQVSDGNTLAESMGRHPQAFNELVLSMVRAGEEGGFLEDVLQRVAIFTEHQEDLKGKVVGALAYPVFLMTMGFAVVTGMLIFFVPKFAPIFERLAERGELPLATKILLAISGTLGNYGIWLFLAVAGLLWWVWQQIQTPEGKRQADYWRLKMWALGPVIQSLAVARFCRILGTLLHNGVPLLPALRISKDATGNVILSEAVNNAAENITSGKSLARPLAASGHFSNEVIEMIRVGEEANTLETVLLNISENLERRTGRQLELAVRLLEPVLLLVMAMMILFVMVALLLPVFQSAGAFG